MTFLTEAEADTSDLVVIATTCDQMRHVPELITTEKPTFMLNMPSTWMTSEAYKLYRDELKRLGEFFCDYGGHAPDSSTLIDAMVAYEERRTGFVRGHTDTLESNAVPLAVTGGPLLKTGSIAAGTMGPNPLMSEIERAGGVVVLDASESGEITQPGKFDRRRLQDQPFDVLVEAYFRIPDIGRRPNSQYYGFLKRELEVRGVRGIIIQRYTWCDLWHAEVQRIKEWATVPVLDLGGDDGADARVATRIQAFMEMLRD